MVVLLKESTISALWNFQKFNSWWAALVGLMVFCKSNFPPQLLHGFLAASLILSSLISPFLPIAYRVTSFEWMTVEYDQCNGILSRSLANQH